MDTDTRDELLYLCRDYSDYINRPDRYSPEQCREAVRAILHRLLDLLTRGAAAVPSRASAE
jgi:hypothetical protein